MDLFCFHTVFVCNASLTLIVLPTAALRRSLPLHAPSRFDSQRDVNLLLSAAGKQPDFLTTHLPVDAAEGTRVSLAEFLASLEPVPVVAEVAPAEDADADE